MLSSKSKLFLAILLPIQILLVQIVSRTPLLVESFYSNGIYPYISRFFRIIFGWVPFSVGDILIAFLFISFFRFLYHLIKTKCKKCYQKIIDFIAVLSLIYGCFYLFWGLNYYRVPLATNLNLKQSSYTTEQLFDLSKVLIKKTNELQFSITKSDTVQVKNPYQPKEMYQIALYGYKNLSKKYPQLAYQYKSIKSSLMSGLQSYNGTSGYLNPLTGEAQVNNRIPKNGYPVITCHEMAHQIGWAAENEANFIGFLAAISNEDIYFQYSGYKMAMRYAIHELYQRDKDLYRALYKTIHKGIKKDFKENYEFWKSYENLFEPIVKKGYNAYLKANKQQNGIQSYNYVVDLLVVYFEKLKPL